MEFVSLSEFVIKQKETQEKLSNYGTLVLTNDGIPSMLVIDIKGKDFVKLINNLRRLDAMDILHKVQIESVRNGTDNITIEEINAKIAAYRQERKCV